MSKKFAPMLVAAVVAAMALLSAVASIASGHIDRLPHAAITIGA